MRSLLGFGAGAVAPVAFGAVLDAGGGEQWTASFAVLGVGGVLATLSAVLLPPPDQHAPGIRQPSARRGRRGAR